MDSNTNYEYEFTKFSAELEIIAGSHPHVIRRESGVTYRDEFALEQLLDLNAELYTQLLTGWSRSYYLREKHLEAIMAYAILDLPIVAVNQEIWNQSVETTKNRLSSLPQARAFDIVSQIDQVSFKSSSAAGYDYQGCKGPRLGANHIRAIQRAKAIMWSVFKNEEGGIEHVIETAVPDVGYTRTQLADITEKTKVRSVWGRAFHYILLEGLVAEPVLEVFKNNETFYHIGEDPTVSVPKILSEVARLSKWIYALDWKQFDATVHRFEINTAFDILKELVIFPNEETKTAFAIVKQLFIHKKIAAPDGRIYWSHKGIPSGSYFTSIIGSIVNFVRIQYLWRIITGHEPKIIYTQGDDSLCGDDILVTPEEFEAAAKPLGWIINPSKTEYSTTAELVSFLGRTYQGGLNKRDLIKCLRLLIYPEFPVESGRISAYRAKSIAEDCGGISDILNRISHRLKRLYGLAQESEVPSHFKRYVPGM